MLSHLISAAIDYIVAYLLLLFKCICKKPLMIRVEKYGRLGNRLYMSAHLIAWAKQTGALLVNLGFYDYEDLFECTSRDSLCRYPESSFPIILSDGFKKLLSESLERTSLRLLNQNNPYLQTINLQPDGVVLTSLEFKKSLTSKPITFIHGFIFDNTLPDINEERADIRRYFVPCNRFQDGIEAPIRYLRENSDIILGILIRHGDYKNLWGGKYYFELSEYIQLMDLIVDYLAPHKLGFFIASDQDQPTQYFNKFHHFFRAGHPIENLGALSLCDGIFTAPSSFTGWAQYYGNIPTFHISKDTDKTQCHEMLDNVIRKSKAA